MLEAKKSCLCKPSIKNFTVLCAPPLIGLNCLIILTHIDFLCGRLWV